MQHFLLTLFFLFGSAALLWGQRGKTHLLFLSCDNYQHIRKLQFPNKEATDLHGLIVGKYLIDGTIIHLKDPTLAEAKKAFEQIRDSSTNDDNLLIFFSGHGEEIKSHYYWAFVDSKADIGSTMLSSKQVYDYIYSTKALHTLVLVDACFGGGIFLKSGDFDEESESDAESTSSCFAISSTALRRVGDGNAFFPALYSTLEENKNPKLSQTELRDSIEIKVKRARKNNEKGSKDVNIHSGPLAGERIGGKFFFYKRDTPLHDLPSPPTPLKLSNGSLHTEPLSSGIYIEMIYVEGGSFMMGCTSEQGNDCWDNEKPAHKVSVDGFYIGKYEVTQGQWKSIMGTNPSKFKNCDQCPVEQVDWNNTQEFIQKLNQQTGKTYRLPTEAEWEYAARGGNETKGYKYAGGNLVDGVAWCYYNSNYKTQPVGEKKPNELGIYDMSGNVEEWCSDWYDPNYYVSSPVYNPRGANSGTTKVLRSSYRKTDDRGCRITVRRGNYPISTLNYGYGFRLVLVP